MSQILFLLFALCAIPVSSSLGMPPGMTDFADPTSDYTFKKLFTDPQNEALLVSFLNNVLEPQEKIETVVLLKSEMKLEGPGSKVFVMDLLCTDQKENKYIVEMEKDILKNQRREDFFKRVQIYTAYAYSRGLKEGQGYNEANPVVCLILTRSKLFEPHRDTGADPYIRRHKIMDEATLESSMKDMKWVFVEFSKFLKSENELSTQLDEWLYLFAKWNEIQRVPAQCSDVIRRAYDCIDKTKWTEAEQNAIAQLKLAEDDNQIALDYAHDKGRKEEQLKNLERAKNFISKGFLTFEDAVKEFELDDELANLLQTSLSEALQHSPRKRSRA